MDTEIWYAALPAFEEYAPAARPGGRRARAEALSDLGRRIVRLIFARRGMGDITFARTETGKPYVPGAALFFNVSHSRDLVCAAFGGEEIGIDIEYVRPRAPHAGRYFTPEERACIARAACPRRAFFDIWTRKEAYLKAIGSGWRFGGAAACAPSCAAEGFAGHGRFRRCVRSFTPAEGYAGALCTPRPAAYAVAALSPSDLPR